MSTELGAVGGTPIPRPPAPAARTGASDGTGRVVTEERLARLRAPDPSRAAVVDAARRRLEAGLLDSVDAYRETARRMIARRI